MMMFTWKPIVFYETKALFYKDLTKSVSFTLFQIWTGLEIRSLVFHANSSFFCE